MKRIIYLLFLIIPRILEGQLKVEWMNEVNLPGETPVISSLFLNDQTLYYSLRGGNGSAIFTRSTTANNATHSFTSTAFISDMQIKDNVLLSFGGCNFTHRTLAGEELSDICLQLQVNQNLSAVSAKIMNAKLYALHWMNTIASYDLSGSLIWKKEIKPLSTNRVLTVGGQKIYVLIDGSLIQYDTLGNQNWSVPVSDVYNIISDKEANCFVLSANDETTVIKYNKKGEIVWSKKTPGQWARGCSIFGDSLIICGNISPGAMTDNKQPCAFTILSASSGDIIYQQVITINEDKNVMEHFSQIATDGKNLYIGGSQSNWGVTSCFILKLSRKQNVTGIPDHESANSYSVFPNPSGSKFTISSTTSISTVYITMRNAAGQVVFSKNITKEPGKNVEVSPGELPTGTYFVEIVSGAKKTVKKIVVE